MKKKLCLLLALVLLLSLGLPARAAEVLRIHNENEFRAFAENCRLDSYSAGKRVYLEADLDFGGTDLPFVPYFSGIFYGQGHRIRGLCYQGDGSHLGLFRYVGEKAVIYDLALSGTMEPGGSRLAVGGLAGSNYGRILNCSYEGSVRGLEDVGGIAGENFGSIAGCRFSGSAVGEHRVGGICGSNGGSVDRCENSGSINTVSITVTADRGFSFDVSSLTAEDFLDITDLGGIAGLSGGIITASVNRGGVGYPHSGYNVGGIAGRGNGYVSGCENFGSICGRKDVGGILGQLLPYTAWEFSESKLNALRTEFQKMNTLVDRTLAELGDGSEDLSARMNSLRWAMDAASRALDGNLSLVGDEFYALVNRLKDWSARLLAQKDYEAIHGLLRELSALLQQKPEEIDKDQLTDLISELLDKCRAFVDPSLFTELLMILRESSFTEPDLDAFFANFNYAVENAYHLGDNLQGTASGLRENLREINNELLTISDTFFTTAADISEVKTEHEKDISARDVLLRDSAVVDGSKNHGPVDADTNAGGIVGAVAYELSFDAEDSLKLSDYLLSDASYLIFAGIRDCESDGDVTAKKTAAGGIAGRMDFGAAARCVSGGEITVTAGDYAGGIAGRCAGSLTNCDSRSRVSAGKYVGGIAGSAGSVTDCLAYTYLAGGSEFVGAVAGEVTKEASGNLFVENARGGIDGVSYAGKAEPISHEEMLRRTDVPESFKDVSVNFIGPDGGVFTVTVPFGGRVETLPEVPRYGLSYWKWDDFENEAICFSLTVRGRYCSPRKTIATEGDRPKFLAEGNFYEDQVLLAEECVPEDPAKLLPDVKDFRVLEAWRLSVEGPLRLTVHMKTAEDGRLYAYGEDGQYTEIGYTRDGSYVVFELENGARFLYVKDMTDRFPLDRICIGGGVLLLLIIVLAVRRSRRKKKAKEKTAGEAVLNNESPKEENT